MKLSLKGFLHYILIALLVACASPDAIAQIELSNSIDMGFPVLLNQYNRNLFYDQLAVGLRFGVSYKPNATQFYPTLDFSFGRTKMPLKQFESNVASINYNYDDLMLKGNFVMSVLGNNTLYLSLGIGFDKLKQKGTDISGQKAGQMYARIDSTSEIDTYFPAIGVGLEYVYGESVNQKVYLSLGVNAHITIYLPERNNYDVYVRDADRNDVYLHAALDGRAITPDFHITLHYMLSKEIFFWQKNDR